MQVGFRTTLISSREKFITGVHVDWALKIQIAMDPVTLQSPDVDQSSSTSVKVATTSYAIARIQQTLLSVTEPIEISSSSTMLPTEVSTRSGAI